jgi:hypothetical protein
VKKATAKAEQFFARSASESTKGSRKGFSLLGGGVDPSSVLTPNQQRLSNKAALTARMAGIQKDLAEQKKIICHNRFAKNKEFFVAIDRRASLTAELMEVLEQLSALKQSAKPRTITHKIERCFVDICSETMPAGQFKTIMAAAIAKAESEELQSQP